MSCIKLRLCCTSGELFPTEVRTTAHGFSAGVAKLGALWATIFFNYIGNKPRFWCVPGVLSVQSCIARQLEPRP